MVEFGESVLYLPLRGNISDKRAAKVDLEPRFLKGVFLGLTDNSDELVVFGPESIRKARTVRRRPEEEMWNREEVLAVRGTPLQPNPGSEETRIKTKMTPGLATTEIIGDPVTAQEVKAETGEKRPFYFMRSDVRTIAASIGFTSGCAGCRAVRLNLNHRPPHSDECRTRMEPEMKKLPKSGARMQQFEYKLVAEVEKRVRDENKLAKTQSVDPVQDGIAQDSSNAQASSTVLDSQNNVDTPQPSTTTSTAARPLQIARSSPITTATSSSVQGQSGHSALGSTMANSIGSAGVSNVSISQGIATTGNKRKNSDDGDGRAAKSISVEVPRGEKRSAPIQRPDEANMEWLDELAKIPGITCDTVLAFEPDEVPNDISEIYSPPRVVSIARRSGLRGGWSIDRLVEYSPGVKWDLSQRSHQLEVLSLIARTEPGLIIGSPPCSWFSSMMEINWPKIGRHRRRQMLAEARSLLKFASEVYKVQNDHGRLFLHEHPLTAKSWKEESITKIMELTSVHKVNLDMCCYGLTTQTASGQQLVKKANYYFGQ